MCWFCFSITHKKLALFVLKQKFKKKIVSIVSIIFKPHASKKRKQCVVKKTVGTKI